MGPDKNYGPRHLGRQRPNLDQPARIDSRTPRFIEHDYVSERVNHRYDADTAHQGPRVSDHMPADVWKAGEAHNHDYIAEHVDHSFDADLAQPARVDDHARVSEWLPGTRSHGVDYLKTNGAVGRDALLAQAPRVDDRMRASAWRPGTRSHGVDYLKENGAVGRDALLAQAPRVDDRMPRSVVSQGLASPRDYVLGRVNAETSPDLSRVVARVDTQLARERWPPVPGERGRDFVGENANHGCRKPDLQRIEAKVDAGPRDLRDRKTQKTPLYLMMQALRLDGGDEPHEIIDPYSDPRWPPSKQQLGSPRPVVHFFHDGSAASSPDNEVMKHTKIECYRRCGLRTETPVSSRRSPRSPRAVMNMPWDPTFVVARGLSPAPPVR